MPVNISEKARHFLAEIPKFFEKNDVSEGKIHESSPGTIEVK